MKVTSIKTTVKAKAPAKAATKTAKAKNLIYSNCDAVFKAGLFGARGKDIRAGGPGLKKGQCIRTHYGICLVVEPVPEVTADVVPFKPNGECFLHDKAGQLTKQRVPCFHEKGRTYAVAKTTTGLRQVELHHGSFNAKNKSVWATLAS